MLIKTLALKLVLVFTLFSLLQPGFHHWAHVVSGTDCVAAPHAAHAAPPHAVIDAVAEVCAFATTAEALSVLRLVVLMVALVVLLIPATPAFTASEHRDFRRARPKYTLHYPCGPPATFSV